MLPTWPLTWSAGYLFGLVPGMIAASLGSTSGALAGFAASRSLVGQWFQRRLAGHPRLRALERAVERQAFKIVLLSRLSPVFPYNVVNYLFGMTAISWQTFTLASWLGMLPVTSVHVYFGTAIENAAELLSGHAIASPARTIALVIGIVASVVVTVVLARIARGAMQEALEAEEMINAK
jgi:uncharacterized membrane protein YdjX (TVP38/TMEM64 family)